MVGIIEAGAALANIKIALDIATGIGSLKSQTDVNQAVIDIQRTLIEAQISAFNDRERIGDQARKIENLEDALKRRDDWKAFCSRYRLTRSPIGAYTYDLKDNLTKEEAFHRLCATCFDSEVKSILHTTAEHSGGEIVTCLRCKYELTLSKFEHKIRRVVHSGV